MSYSEFFSSGFKAMVNRSGSMSFSPEKSVGGGFRTTSPTPPCSDSANSTHSGRRSQSRPTSPTLPPSPTKSRRSSQRLSLTFSSWILHRTTSPPPASKGNSLDMSDDACLSASSASDSSQSSEESSSIQPIDPFAASPQSNSFFSDSLLLSPLSTTSINNPRSFLSFAESPSSPSSDRPFHHFHDVLPLPSQQQKQQQQQQSHHSYYQSSYPQSPSRAKAGHALAESLAENSRSPTPEPLTGVEETLDWFDPSHSMDWRQFHIELLDDEP